MKKNSVLAVLVALLCCCTSFGNGDERIYEARKTLRRRYHGFRFSLKEPDSLLERTSVYRYLREMEDKEMKWLSWMEETTGYSPEQFSILPESMTEDELILATEYHLWQSEWYHVRYIALHNVVTRRRQVRDKYPNTDKCTALAWRARDLFEAHKNKYSKCYEALGKNAKQDIMKEIKFPHYLPSQELHHEYSGRRNDLLSDCRNHAGNYAIFQVKTMLHLSINDLLKRKLTIDSGPVYKKSSIVTFLSPSGRKPIEAMMSKLHNFFPVEDLSQPPDKALRSDKEFLEVAWLFNRYRTLWYEIRYIEIQKFLRHRGQGLKKKFAKRVMEAKEITKKLFQSYDSLYNDYQKVFLECQEGLEQGQFGGEQQRNGKIVSAKAHETADNHFLIALESLENVGSKTPELFGNSASGAQLEFDLEIALPVMEDARELPEFDLNVAPLETGETEEDAVKIDSVAPKRLKLTGLDDDQSQWRHNLENVHQFPLQKCSSESGRTEEKASSSSKTQFFNFF